MSDRQMRKFLKNDREMSYFFSLQIFNGNIIFYNNIMENQIFIDKIVNIENEITKIKCSFKMKVLYLPESRQLNISRAICQIHSRGIHIENSHFFYQDYERCIYVYFGTYPFSSEVYLSHQYFPTSIISLRFKKISQITKQTNKSTKKPLPTKKPKERTIGEVMESVKKWKQLIKKVDENGKKQHTMESAAHQLGIQKKTLDDYNYQLQLGESYGFNFQKHKNEKIGFLRQFIKKKKEELKYIQNTDNYWALSDKDSEEKQSRSEESDN